MEPPDKPRLIKYARKIDLKSRIFGKVTVWQAKVHNAKVTEELLEVTPVYIWFYIQIYLL